MIELGEVRIIVAGGRDFYDHQLLAESLDKIIAENYEGHEIIIVNGEAPGADREGKTYANRKGYKIDSYPAEWTRLGKGAGHVRNELMAQNADVLVAFWNERSPGTANMIDYAEQYGLETHIIRY